MEKQRGEGILESKLRLGAVALAAGVFLAGCGSQSATPKQTGASRLVIGVDNGSPTFTDNFSPFSPNLRQGTSYIYEPLFNLNTLTGQAIPWLATGYHWKDNQELVMTIRSGVRWNDGKPFSAKDVAFTFNYMKQHPALDWQGLWKKLASVTASGNQVIFRLQSPDGQLFDQIATTIIIPQHIWASIKHPTKQIVQNPVGTGPYMVSKFTPYQYTLTKNPFYWQSKKIQVKSLVFPVMGSSQTASLKMSSGQWDWGTIFMPNVQKTYVAKNPKYNHYWFPAGGTIALSLNLTQSPYSDVNFRKAVAYAINRQKIATQAEYGYVQPANQTGLLPSQKQWLNPAIPHHAMYTYNLQKAQTILKNAGYHLNTKGQLLDKSGRPVSLSIEVPSGWSDWIATAQIIQSNLKRLGISVQVLTPQYSAYSSSLSSGQYQGALVPVGGTPNPFNSYYPLLDGRFYKPIGQNAVANQERFKSASADAILHQWQLATSHQANLQYAYRIEKVMYQQVPVIALFYGAVWNEYSTKKFVGWPTAKNPYANPAPYGQSPLIVLTHLRPRT